MRRPAIFPVALSAALSVLLPLLPPLRRVSLRPPRLRPPPLSAHGMRTRPPPTVVFQLDPLPHGFSTFSVTVSISSTTFLVLFALVVRRHRRRRLRRRRCPLPTVLAGRLRSRLSIRLRPSSSPPSSHSPSPRPPHRLLRLLRRPLVLKSVAAASAPPSPPSPPSLSPSAHRPLERRDQQPSDRPF